MAPIPSLNDTRANDPGAIDTSAPTGARAAQADSPVAGDRPDFDRLEAAILALLDRYQGLRRENARLFEALAARDRRVEELESQLREGNQLQRDIAKRIDDLLGQIDQIEHHFTERGA